MNLAKELKLSAKSELELYQLMQGLGELAHGTKRGVAKGHIAEESGKSDIDHYTKLQEDVLTELVNRFDVVHPQDERTKPADGDWSKLPAPPDGKKWYWQWYKEMQSLDYQGIICSSCPFSTGDMDELNRMGVCCSIIPSGFCYLRPTVPWECALVRREGVFGDRDEFTTEKLLVLIKEKFGEDAMDAFLKKEQELKDRYVARMRAQREPKT